jgi:hypothetical protein
MAPSFAVIAGLDPAIHVAEGGFATLAPRVKPEGDGQRNALQPEADKS